VHTSRLLPFAMVSMALLTTPAPAGATSYDAKDFEAPVGIFLASCAEDASYDSKCNGLVTFASVGLTITARACSPATPTNEDVVRQTSEIVLWLRQHPKDESTEDALTRAIQSLFPCRK
jgi:hypothetical protein